MCPRVERFLNKSGEGDATAPILIRLFLHALLRTLTPRSLVATKLFCHGPSQSKIEHQKLLLSLFFSFEISIFVASGGDRRGDSGSGRKVRKRRLSDPLVVEGLKGCFASLVGCCELVPGKIGVDEGRGGSDIDVDD